MSLRILNSKKFSEFIWFTLIIVAFLFINACQESYSPEDIDSSKKILVVDGSISNNPGPYMISLSYSSPFSDKYSYNYINDAKVYISDDAGNSELLNEKGSGKYFTSETGIRGIPGRYYKLRIELSDGSIFESVPAILNPAPVFDSIYPVMTIRDVATSSSNGKITVGKASGVELRFSATTSEKVYYRFSSSVTTQWTHTVYPMNGNPFDVHCWENTYLNSSVDVKSTVLNGSKYVIREHIMGFLQYVFENRSKSQNNTQIGPRKQEGWNVITHIYSISPEAYIYFGSVAQQLVASNRIFDPIPSQLRGNISCITDSSKIALGLFDVSSESVVYNAFYWTSGMHTVYKRTADSIPKISEDNCINSRYPSFWVNFYIK